MEVAGHKAKRELTKVRAEGRAAIGELTAMRRERASLMEREREMTNAIVKLRRHIAQLQAGTASSNGDLDADIDVGLTPSEAKKLRSQLSAAREQTSSLSAEASSAK